MSHTITGLLARWRENDHEALDQLTALVLDEIVKRARSTVRGKKQIAELTTTELVDEVFVRLVEDRMAGARDRTHFYRIMGRVMTGLVIDAIRHRRALKRGGGTLVVPLSEAHLEVRTQMSPEQLLALGESLDELRDAHERSAQVVELRYFVGMTEAEVAALLDVSRATVQSDWRFARAFLRGRLEEGDGAVSGA